MEGKKVIVVVGSVRLVRLIGWDCEGLKLGQKIGRELAVVVVDQLELFFPINAVQVIAVIGILVG